MNDDDAGLLRLTGIVELHFLPFEGDGARIPGIDAGEHFHEGGLPGAVFPHQGVDLAGTDLEIDISQRVNAGEGLVDAFHRQDHFTHEAASFILDR